MVFPFNAHEFNEVTILPELGNVATKDGRWGAFGGIGMFT
jgi:hypothetical protein